jgi:hypothetical protein
MMSGVSQRVWTGCLGKYFSRKKIKSLSVNWNEIFPCTVTVRGIHSDTKIRSVRLGPKGHKVSGLCGTSYYQSKFWIKWSWDHWNGPGTMCSPGATWDFLLSMLSSSWQTNSYSVHIEVLFSISGHRRYTEGCPGLNVEWDHGRGW